MAAKKEAKTRARARGKAQREAEREVRAKARQKTIRYAADGTRIGDDGLPMTKARTRLHNLYNACFIVMCVSFIGAAVCIGLSYFQGATAFRVGIDCLWRKSIQWAEHRDASSH